MTEPLNQPTGTYRVLIHQEGSDWVARDQQGNKRAWGGLRFAQTAADAAAAIFHADEIKSVQDHGDEATAEIYEYGPQPETKR